MIEKSVWRENWLESINELTSLELQKKSWLDFSSPSPHWSYAEFMCCYFDDTLSGSYEPCLEQGLLNNEEYEIIKDWHKKLDEYKEPEGSDYDPQKILNDKNWLDIIQAGEIAKLRLAKLLDDTEKAILIGKINYPP